MRTISKDVAKAPLRYSAPQCFPRVWHVARFVDAISLGSLCLEQTHNHPPPKHWANRELARIGLPVAGHVLLGTEAKRSADWARRRPSIPDCALELRDHQLKTRSLPSCS